MARTKETPRKASTRAARKKTPLVIRPKLQESKPSRKAKRVFQFQSLSPNPEAFRLLKISRVDRNGIICCTIEEYEAFSCPPYIAVSYCWGSDTELRTIKLNGQNFLVRSNLLSLLHNIHSAVRGKYLWIDAICIDQSSNKERNHQVRLMGQIYSDARMVIAWLGEMDEDCETTLRYLRYVRQYDNSRECSRAAIAARLENFENLLALRRFFEKAYWHRTWIIQEILLASKVRLMCGSKEVKWSQLEELKELWSVSDFPGAERARMMDVNENILFRFMDERQKSYEKPGLIYLIRRYKSSQCQDPRDKIYALISLAGDCDEDKTLDVDYDKSLGQIFCDVMEFSDYYPSKYRMMFADVIRETLNLKLDDIQEFIAFESSFTWESMEDLNARVTDDIDDSIDYVGDLMRFEGLLVGTVTNTTIAQESKEPWYCFDCNDNTLETMQTCFDVAGTQDARFASAGRFSRSGSMIFRYTNLSFDCIAPGDFIYQLGTSRLALVLRPVGREDGYFVAVARIGNINLLPNSDKTTPRKSFWLTPAEVLGLQMMILARNKTL